MMKQRKIGMFRVHLDLINNDPDSAREIMGEVIVIGASLDVHRQCVTYIALCDQFDDLPEYLEAPEYTCQLKRIENGYSITFRRTCA